MAGPKEMPTMEAAPSVERETPSPESGEREKVIDAGDAERELGELGKQVEADGRDIANETSKETQELSTEIPARYDTAMSTEEAAQVASLDARTSAAQERLSQEVGAALSQKSEAAPSMSALDGKLREIDQQLEEAHKKGDGNKRQELEAQRSQVDDERKKLMAEQAAAKAVEAVPAAPEPAPAPVAETAPPTTADKLRDLEKQYKELEGSEDSWAADKKATLEREMEAVTREHEAGPKAEAEPPAAAEQAVEPEPQPASVLLEGKLRDLEAQYKEAQAANDPDKKAALERQLEATTKEWQDVAKAEGHVVERPREPVLERGEAANDNAVAVDEGPEVTSRDATAEEEAEVMAAVAEDEAGGAQKEAPKEKKKAVGADLRDDEFEELSAIDGMSDEAGKEYVDKLRKEIAANREAEEAKKKAEGNIFDKAGRKAGWAYDVFKDSGLKTFMEGAAEMVGAKSGTKIESQMLEGLSAERKKFKEKMKSLAERKTGLDEKASELQKKRKKLKQRKENGEDVSEEEKELEREEEEIEKEVEAVNAEVEAAEKENRKAIKAEKKQKEEAAAAEQAEAQAVPKAKAEGSAEAAQAEQAKEEETSRVVVAEMKEGLEEIQEKVQQEEAEQPSADREAIIPPEPVVEGPDKPEPPEPPAAAAQPPEVAPPAPPAETKMAA